MATEITTIQGKGAPLNATEFDNNFINLRNAADELMSSFDKAKFDSIEVGAQVNTVTSVASKTGAVTLSKSDVGLNKVDNTADINKPVSTLTQTALNGKSDTGHNHDTVYVKKTDINGLVGNLSAPLTHLPLKKNLLTAQGQSAAVFSRASSATHIDRYGVVKSDSTDTARFSKDGLLIEPSGTNSFIRSQDFDNASWGKNECTITANTTATTDPCGTNLAEKLIPSTVLTGHYVWQTVTPTSGTVYTFSCFAKKGEYNYIGLLFPYGNAQFPTLSVAVFDLNTGTVAFVENATLKAKIEPFANGWYRCSITETCTASISGQASIRAYPSSSPTSYSGDGTSGIYIFGAQMEPGFSSYIPTTSSAATRAYDSLSIPMAENVPYYANDFSVAVDVSVKANRASNYILSDGLDFTVYMDANGYVYAKFGSVTLTSSSAYTAGTKLRILFVKSGSTLYLYVNGTQVASGTVGTLPANQTNLYIGSYNGTTNQFFGYISNVRFWDFALSADSRGIA